MWMAFASRWRTTFAASTSSSTTPRTRRSTAPSGRSVWLPTARTTPLFGHDPATTPHPISPSAPLTGNENDPPSVAAHPWVQASSVAQSLFALAYRDVLGLACGAHRL